MEFKKWEGKTNEILKEAENLQIAKAIITKLQEDKDIFSMSPETLLHLSSEDLSRLTAWEESPLPDQLGAVLKLWSLCQDLHEKWEVLFEGWESRGIEKKKLSEYLSLRDRLEERRWPHLTPLYFGKKEPTYNDVFSAKNGKQGDKDEALTLREHYEEQSDPVEGTDVLEEATQTEGEATDG